MTVNYKTSGRSFTSGQVLCNVTDLVNDLVIESLGSTTEAFMDAAFDGQNGDPSSVTHAGIMANLNQDAIKSSALEYLSDMLGDLQLMVKQRMAAVEYRPVVNSIQYDEDGKVTDIVVTVKVTDSAKPNVVDDILKAMA